MAETVGPAAPLPPKAPSPPAPNPLHVLLDEALAEWMNSSLRNSPISQATSAWNHLVVGLPKLREILIKKLS